jgi:ethanolamine utilization protein EutN
MRIARVVGSTVSTVKLPDLVGSKLLIVQPSDVAGEPTGDAIVAVDAVGAGVGETVLVVTGSSAREVQQVRNAPVDAVIVAIVDTLDTSAGG